MLLKTVAHSLRILHDLDIVHSDLKPSNVLIKRTELGYTTKLIDFDSSYIVGSPPPPDDIVGTMNYYSPELVRYIQGAGDGAELTEASDVFALGLIYTEYLTGALPAFDPAFHEAAVAVLNGANLALPPAAAPQPISDLVEQMLRADPTARPRIEQVHATLMGWRSGSPTRAARLGPPPPMTGSTGAASSLRGKGLRLVGQRTPVKPTSPGPPGGTRSTSGGDAGAPVPEPRNEPGAPTTSGGLGNLVGKLLGKFEERRSR